MQEDQPTPLTDSDIESMTEVPTRVRLAPSQVMSIRFSADELRALADEAARCGLTVGLLVKRAALDAALLHTYSATPEVKFGFSGLGQGVSGATVPQRMNVDSPASASVSGANSPTAA